MSKNKTALVYAVVNAVLVLLVTQLAEGVYPIPEPYLAVSKGLVALVVAALTAASPWFDWREASR